MLLVCAPELGSETVTLSTYYPAPSGVYTKMITTDNTWLARDGGNVGIGTAAPSPSVKLYIKGLVRVGNYPADGTLPAGVAGAIYYDTTTKMFRGHDGTAWNDVGVSPWGENAVANIVSLNNNGRRVVIGPLAPAPPSGFLDVNGTMVSRQGASCTQMIYNIDTVTVCPAGRYVSTVAGVMSKYGLAALYDISPGEDEAGLPLPGIPTGRMFCCPCPAGGCPSL